MLDQNAKEVKHAVRNRRAHLANERTFLAWVRTSIAIMAFGFVVEKFALFLRKMQQLVAVSGHLAPEVPQPLQGQYSSLAGIILVGMGALMGVLAFIRYYKVKKQIDEDTYQPSMLLNILLAILVLAIGIFLIIYLLKSL